MTLPYPPPFQDLKTLSEHTCIGESTIETYVRLGTFPAPRKRYGKRLWVWAEVAAHLAAMDADVAASKSEAEGIREATKRALASGR